MKTKIISLSLLLFFMTFPTKAQQWEFVGLDSMVIKQLYVSKDSIWAGTAVRNGANINAGLYFSSDAGNSWVQIDSSLGGGSIVGMENLGNGKIYIIKGLSQYSSGGSLYKTTNNGTSWDSINISGYAISWIGVSPFNSDEVYALDVSFFPSGVLNYLYKSADGGSSWEDISAFPASSHGSALTFAFDMVDSNSLYVTVDTQFNLYLFKSTDKGTSWFYVSTPPIVPIEIHTDYLIQNRIYLIAKPYVSNDGGHNWFAADSGFNVNAFFLSFYQDKSYTKLLYDLRTDGLYSSQTDTFYWSIIDGSQNLPVYFGPNGFYDDRNMNNIFIEPNKKELFLGTSEGIYKTSIITNVNENYKKYLDFSLSQNFPNPFNSTTMINFGLPEENNAVLELYNVLGKKIRDLINGFMPSGKHSFQLNAEGLPSGTYFYVLRTPGFTETKKLILLK